MKMTTLLMKTKLEQLLQKQNRSFSFNREKDQLTVRENGGQITLSLPQIIARYEEEGENAVTKISYYVNEGLRASSAKPNLSKSLSAVFPVIRASSFPKQTKAGETFLTSEHTAETTIYYVIDQGQSYHFITETMREQAGFTQEQIEQAALKHVNVLPVILNEDTVSQNRFYFLRANDGYDASRVLNLEFLAEMRAKINGEMVLSIPHQDVLIIADIQNETGYDVMAHMTMKFFAEGLVPVTSLPFVYNDGKLEPIFIMAKNQPKE
ncbi:hypothetical protein MFLO_06254 [Listeria floridensis FSL S10-1187]|uniref:Uncharacterized protein n=1 Tax=Listeria floridensis FSL S10-1187 TaxID=1265817 RepID=A0ABN0RGE2_9LIST|nr:DUF1444 family protein [Listeria floridensis]EUJ32868.1 hypothetical protein MFLO_06254 [Listeria floridensis FSL S10-1187]